MHQLMQSWKAIVRQLFADHACGKRPYFDHVILEAERPRLVRDRAQNDGRIREAMIFAKENKLRLSQFRTDHVAARPRELSILHLERKTLWRSRRQDCGRDEKDS